MSSECLCYNKGCAKKFIEEDNADDVCVFHPGVPVFHDAMKGWSCCKKRCIDFTDFLNIPGCTRGRHNPVKPAEPVKNVADPLEKGEVIEVKAPAPKPKVPTVRPSEDEPCIPLKVTVAGSLRSALARLKKSEEEKQANDSTNRTEEKKGTEEEEEVAIGTQCKHSGCQTTYLGPDSNLTDCQYHPGVPIFHEGYKLWSCCQRRTSDFNEFLRQEGCKAGNHEWKGVVEDKPPRCDWHQTGSQVVISLFSKCSVPEACHFTANKTTVNAVISYEGGKRTFRKTWKLEGVIDPTKSAVELLGTKAEIKLRKFDGMPWKYLELVQVPKKTENNNEKTDENDDN